MTSLKEKAIELRNRGFSYTEIQKEISISKSTLSLWLRSVKLTSEQEFRLKALMRAGQPFGARAQKEIRIKKTEEIITKAKNEISEISKKDLWHMGIMLYWAEGSKQKVHLSGQRVVFNNSDPYMIKIYLKWLTELLKVDRNQMNFEIYSHENIKNREQDVVKYWSTVTGFSKSNFTKIYYKRDKKKKYRKNQGKNYYGLLRVIVLKSTDLNRKITGWIKGICTRCEVL